MPGKYDSPQAQVERFELAELFAILGRHRILIAAVTLMVTGGTFGWICTRRPVYRASATLLLEEDEAAGGALGELASLTVDPRAAAEIALLESRSLAAVTAAAPEERATSQGVFRETAPDFDPFATHVEDPTRPSSAMEQLALATEVERLDLRPLATLLTRLRGQSLTTHRLRAWMEPDSAGGDVPRPPKLDVTFPAESGGRRVSIAIPAGAPWSSGADPLELDYTPGAPVVAHGWRLWLTAAGEYVGQSYRVRRVGEERTINRLMERTSAVESGRQTNVVHLTVDAVDPHRAAEIANALCTNYIRRSVQIGQQKANRTAGFIQTQLDEQLAALTAAEEEVVRAQAARPETFALPVAAAALIEQTSAVDLQIAELRLTRNVLDEALTCLEEGDAQSLARLAQGVPNLLAVEYVKELGRLEAEALRLERSDVPGYKALLTAEELRLRGLAEAGDIRIQLLEETLAALDQGDSSAVARLGAAGEFPALSAELGALEGELGRLRGDAKDANPLVQSLLKARTELIDRLRDRVRSALEGARSTVAAHRDLVETYSTNVAEWPAQERETIDEARQALRVQVAGNLRSQIAGIDDMLTDLGERAAELEERMASLPDGELALAGPLRRRETHASIVSFLLTSQQEANISAAATSAAAVLIDPATPPRMRVFPRITVILLLGAVGGMLVGCAMALGINRLRGALYTEAEVEHVSGLPVLGAIPSFTRGRTRVAGATRNSRFSAMLDQPGGPQAEACRQVRAALRLSQGREGAPRVVAITSCVPEEGKTTTNLDLAFAFAEAGQRVLLVDGDFRKPRIHSMLEIDRSPGFGEVLEGRAEWLACVRPGTTTFPDVLPAGRSRTGIGEVLASDAVRPTLDAFRAAYDLVVIDLPPAMIAADVASFASQLDALMLVYRSGRAPGRLLQMASSRLRRAGANLVGVILNDVVVGGGTGQYGYGYGDHGSHTKRGEGLRRAS